MGASQDMADPKTFLVGVTPEELDKDPYPTFAAMRRECPVAYYEPTGQWIVSKWDDCAELGGERDRVGASHVSREVFGVSVLSLDGDPHMDLRKGIDPPLRPRVVPEYNETLIRPAIQEYLERLRPLGRADASQDLLERVSVAVIGDLMGLAEVGDEQRQEWFQSLAGAFNDLSESEDIMEAGVRKRAEIDDYFRAKIAELTLNPDSSLLSHMIHASVPVGQPRDFDTLIGSLRVLVTGGFQEPGHAVAASLLGLLQHPDQMQLALDDPETYLPAAVQEGLRWLPPFPIVERRAATTFEIGGAEIPEGAEIALAVASANRDESRYANPDDFDITRQTSGQAAFGYGRHFCSGHAISQQFGGIVLEETIKGLPGLRLDPDASVEVTGFHMRGVRKLPVVWDV